MSKFFTKSNMIEDMLSSQKEKSKIHYLPTGMVPIVLVAVFILSDYIFISQLLDYYFCDEAWRGMLASFVVATIIDISPTIIAACIMVKDKKPIHYVGIGTLAFMEIVLFAVLGYVRINSADLIFSISSTTLVSSTNLTPDTTTTAGQSAMSWLFVVLPIATSILSFIIGIISDSDSSEKYTNKAWYARLYDKVVNGEAQKMELVHVINSDFENVTDKQMDNKVDWIKAEEAIERDKVKIMLALHCKNPQATSEIFSRKVE